jgi:predicted negative regulator of RcsB-dependent stress response
MQNIQDLFDTLQVTKKEQKEIRKEYADALINANGYTELTDELKKLKEKKKQIEAMTQSRMGERYTKLENLKKKAEELDQEITDVAMSTLMEGKTVEIKDQYDNAYEPVYKISFKKVQLQKKFLF